MHVYSNQANANYNNIRQLKGMNQFQIDQRHIEIQIPTITRHKEEHNKPHLTINTETKVSQVPTEIQMGTRLKSVCRKIIIGLIISISGLMFGISLKEITSIPIVFLIKQYNIPMGKSAAQAILIGILPIGAVLGVFATQFMLTRYRRLTGIYFFTFINVGAIVLINISNFGTLVVGRFIEGICIGFYSNVAPIYLKEIAPKELRKFMGLFFSFSKIVGVLLIIMIEMLLEAHPDPMGFRIILSLTAVFAVLQSVLIFFFGSDTPAEMIEKGKEEAAMKIIQRFYKDSYVRQIFDEYKKQYEAQAVKGKQTLSQDLNVKKKRKNPRSRLQTKKNKDLRDEYTEENLDHIKTEPNVINFLTFPTESADVAKEESSEIPEIPDDPNEKVQPGQVTLAQKKKNAYILVLHLAVIKHFTGGQCIISQGGLFITSIDPQLGNNTPLIINVVQFVFIVLSLTVVQKCVGKRPVFLFSVTMLSFLNFALAIAMIYEQIFVCEFIMCLYLAVYGGAFISPIWSYPSQITPASQALIPNIIHWFALALSTLIPPLVAGAMPKNNSYPVFIFFGLYGFGCFFHIFRFLKESDGKTYNEIIQTFK